MPTQVTDDEQVTCRICGKPIAPGEPRYREVEGDVHLGCHDRQWRRPGTE